MRLLDSLSAICKIQWSICCSLGFISPSAAGDVVRIDGNMKTEKYSQILITDAILSGKRLIRIGFFFQHDSGSRYIPG